MFALSLRSPPWWRERSLRGRSPPRPHDWSEVRGEGRRVWYRPAGREAGRRPAHTEAPGSAGYEANRQNSFLLQNVDYLLARKTGLAGEEGEISPTLSLLYWPAACPGRGGRLLAGSSFTTTGCWRDLTASAAEIDPTIERWRWETVGLERPQWSE